MTKKMLEEQWTADPTRPGFISVGDAVTIHVEMDYNKVLYSEVGASRLERALRAIREAEALVLAAPAMAKALLLNGRRNPAFAVRAWHTHDCWENKRASCSEACKATVAALAAAGVPLP